MLADGNDQHPLTHLDGVSNIPYSGIARLAPLAREESYRQQRSHHPCDHEAPRHEQWLPPPRALFRQPRRNLPPHASTVVLARLGHGYRVQRAEHLFQLRQLRAAFPALLQMSGRRFAAFRIALPVSKQLFFRCVFHDSVPTARAAPRGSTKGFSADRNFCTARNTVFFAALVFDFSTAAISSIPQPSQCRITIAVRSAGVSVSSASFILAASCALPANRSGDGARSFTSLNGSGSGSPSATRCGCSRRASSFFRCRSRSIA